MEYVPILLGLGALVLAAIGVMLLLERFVVNGCREVVARQHERRRGKTKTAHLVQYGNL